jgi:hypothetical protein
MGASMFELHFLHFLEQDGLGLETIELYLGQLVSVGIGDVHFLGQFVDLIDEELHVHQGY